MGDQNQSPTPPESGDQNPPTPPVSVLASIYRVYASNKNSFQSLRNVSFNNNAEIQVCLAFARDYDEKNQTTMGKFRPYFDQKLVTRDEDFISEFKNTSGTPVKFFLSIGGRSKRFPFRIKNWDDSKTKTTWINNAVESLREIIKDYKIDGLDIYYNHIESPAFAEVIGAVVDELKKLKPEDGGITEFSISPSASHNERHYQALYQKCAKDDITTSTTVAYQSQYENGPLYTVDELKNLFEKLVKSSGYPEKQLLPGHTILPSDWSNVPLTLFQAAIPTFLDTLKLPGFSMWTVFDHDPEKDSSMENNIQIRYYPPSIIAED